MRKREIEKLIGAALEVQGGKVEALSGVQGVPEVE